MSEEGEEEEEKKTTPEALLCKSIYEMIRWFIITMAKYMVVIFCPVSTHS